MLIFVHSQKVTYPIAYDTLVSKKFLPKQHELASLSPYLDEQGLMRVGGRLQKAALSSTATHPLILSPKSHAVELLVRQTHCLMLHAGTSTVMATLAHSYHIPRLKPLLRKVSRFCVKVYAKTSSQLMGELPAARTQPARPFSITGLDFAGPLTVKRGNPRKPTRVKVYICLFVCFVTKATHLEIVSDLSTPAFLASLTRFVARRGCPSQSIQITALILLEPVPI